MKSIKDATIHSAKWSAIEKFSIQGIKFLLGLIMARLLSPSDFGAIAMITIFIVMAETFVDSGFGLALIRNKKNTEEDYSTVFYFNLVVSIICCIVLILSAPYIAKYFKMPILLPVLRVLSLNVIINSLMTVPVARLTIDLNFKAIAMQSMASSIISGLVGVTLAYMDFGVWALVWQTMIASLVNLSFVYFYCKWMPKLIFSRNSFSNLFNYGSKLLAANIINRIYMNLTDPIIGKTFSAEALGFYNRGTGLATYPVDSVNSVLGKILFPIMAKIQDDHEHLISVYSKYIRMLSLIIFFACCLLAALAKPTIIILLTEKWLPSVVFLQIFIFSVMFDHLQTVNLKLLQVVGRSDLFLKVEIVKKIICFVILISSIHFGVIGVCVSKVITAQVALIINTYYTGKLFNIGYIAQVRDFSKYLICALFACAPAYALTYVGLPSLLTLIVGSLTSVLLYWSLIQKDQTALELFSIVKSQLKK